MFEYFKTLGCFNQIEIVEKQVQVDSKFGSSSVAGQAIAEWKYFFFFPIFELLQGAPSDKKVKKRKWENRQESVGVL